MRVDERAFVTELKSLIKGELERLTHLYGETSINWAAEFIDDPSNVMEGELHDTVMALPACTAALTLRRFVVDARWPGGNFIEEATLLDDLVTSAKHGNLLSLYSPTPDLTKKVLDAALARWKLESEEGDLSIKEIALLANLDEGTVRNAASLDPTHKGHLPRYKSGKSVLVRVADARAWLADKRGFKPTRYEGAAESDHARRSAVIHLTEGNINNDHFYLRECLDLFPATTIGGASTKEEGEAIEVHWGGDEPAVTDIAGDKKIFRRRGWVGRFFRLHGLREGDAIVLHRIADDVYHVYPAIPAAGAQSQQAPLEES